MAGACGKDLCRCIWIESVAITVGADWLSSRNTFDFASGKSKHVKGGIAQPRWQNEARKRMINMGTTSIYIW